MAKFTVRKMARILGLISIAAVVGAQAQTFNTWVNFDGTDGGNPVASLVQGLDGNFYGTTTDAGEHNGGTIFKITSSGVLTTLYNFCSDSGCEDGAYPEGTLALGSDGNFYGTTLHGGVSTCQFTCGTLFKITPDGRLTTIYLFSGDDGSNPVAGLIQAADGSFYGTTVAGGANGNGTLFKVTSKGKLTTLYTFCSQPNCSDGGQPTGNLVQGMDGNFYGTTSAGGLGNCYFGGCGTVFRITPNGQLETLHSFCQTDCSDGAVPWAGLFVASNGSFYGTTTSGGGDAAGGTIFKLTPTGKLTTIYGFFCNSQCEDGDSPFGELFQGTDGALYGTTGGGGTFGDGTMFRLTARGSLTTLHNFNGTDGDSPFGGLLQATNGIFYGTTFMGDSNACGGGCGTLYSLDMGLDPFVTFVRGYGKVGQTGGILGQGLTGTTGVAIHGIQANFTVVSDTYIKATVPAGATTGNVTVITPTGALTSNVPFQVIP